MLNTLNRISEALESAEATVSDDLEIGHRECSRSGPHPYGAAVSDDELHRLQVELITANMPLADSLACRYHDRGEDLEDLVQVARMALVQAVHRFDSERGNFAAFAIPTITGELKRHFRDHVWAVRPPRRIQELQSDLSAAWADLAQVLGRIPTDRELAEFLNEDPANVSVALAAHGCFYATSLDAPSGGSSTQLRDRLGEEDPRLDWVDVMASLAPACARLAPADQRLLYLRFFEQRTQVEIATELGTNQMAVSRSLTRVLTQLRQMMSETQAMKESRGAREAQIA